MSPVVRGHLHRDDYSRITGPRIAKPGQDRKTIADFDRFIVTLAAASELVNEYPHINRPHPATRHILKEVGVEPLPNVVDMQGRPMEMANYDWLAVPLSGIVAVYPVNQRQTAS